MDKEQNDIFKKQNEPKMHELLVAQHFTYKLAKRKSYLLFTLLVFIPIIINIILLFKLSDTIVTILTFFTLSLIFLNTPLQSSICKQKKLAAMLQQQFDCYLFDMAISDDIDSNLIAIQLEKYKEKDWKRKRNWYQNYESIEYEKAIFFCQKENIDWTSNIDKKYYGLLITLLIPTLSLYIVNLILHNAAIITIFSNIIIFLPLFQYMISLRQKIKNDKQELIEINKFANEIEKDFEHISSLELNTKLYCLQKLIYKFRQTKLLIPDFFNNIHHNKLQAIEERKLNQRINKYIKKTAKD